MGVCNRQRAAVLGFEGRESIDGWEESEANARLIASLPTLLAERDALKAALEASRAELETVDGLLSECRQTVALCAARVHVQSAHRALTGCAL